MNVIKDHCTGWYEYIKEYIFFGKKIYIGDCCKEHDTDYARKAVRYVILSMLVALTIYIGTDIWGWAIAIFYPFALKLIFDIKLLICVSKKGKLMFIVGILMFIAVSTFGWIFWIISQVKVHTK